MHLQPNRNYVSNDDVQTPPALARRLVAHFRPRGRILEPCAGDGNFLRALRSFAPRPISVRWCECKRRRDFFAWREPVDWIVTNPPWSQFREFLRHAMTLADHVVFLVTINHLWTRARIRDITTAGFGLKEIVMVDVPANFPPMGFQLGAVHLARGWRGPVRLTDWTAGKAEAGTPSSGMAMAKSAGRRPKAGASISSRARRRRVKSHRLPSQWMSAAELAALSPDEHLRLILRAA